MDIACILPLLGVGSTQKEGQPKTLVQDKPGVVANGATFKNWLAGVAKGDLDHAPYAEDAQISDPTGTYKGKAQIIDSFRVWTAAFPQASAQVTNQVSEGDQLVSEVIYRGTHSGPLTSRGSTIAPTGKQIELRIAIVSSFRAGLIQRERAYFDLAGLMQQLGVTPPRA